MSETLQHYQTKVQALPECDDTWFPEALARARSGDEESRRRILGSNLRVALRLAEERHDPKGADDIFNLIQEANNGLTRAFASFQGQSAQDFVDHVTATVAARLDHRTNRP